jgi:hypothetical protein
VQVNAWVSRQELVDTLGRECREIVGDDVDLIP